jgi:hypothetical protein
MEAPKLMLGTKHSVHHVDVEPPGAAPLGRLDELAQPQQVGGQDRRADRGFTHPASLETVAATAASDAERPRGLPRSGRRPAR